MILTVKKLGGALTVAVMAASAFADVFCAGFARTDLEPQMGLSLSGYFELRPCTGVKDPVEANCVAMSAGGKTALLYSLDLVELKGVSTAWRRKIAEACGTDPAAVYLACTHTHTAPSIGPAADSYEISFDGTHAYDAIVLGKLIAAGQAAIADLSAAEMRVGRTGAKGLSFIRRYRMRDGKVRTNPGRGRIDQVIGPAGEPDDDVRIVRLERGGKPSIALVNFQCHPDMIGGSEASADWPGFMRRAVERDLGVKAILFNGAQGDTNHLNLHDWHNGYDASRVFGEKLAAAVCSAWNGCEKAAPGGLHAAVREVEVKIRKPAAAELASTNLTKVAANRIAKLKDHPETVRVPVTVLKFGDTLAFAGLPLEPFTAIGREVKVKSKAKMTFFTCLTNGSFGYLPTADAYDEGAYETDSSIFAPGVSDALTAVAVEELNTGQKDK